MITLTLPVAEHRFEDLHVRQALPGSNTCAQQVADVPCGIVGPD